MSIPDSEWKTDEHGQRYRMIGGLIKEYEMMVYIDGIPIPESQVEAYNARKAAATAARVEEQRRQEAELHTGKICPLGSKACRADCAMYSDGCSMAHYATEGKRCPYNSQICRKDCGQFKERT